MTKRTWLPGRRTLLAGLVGLVVGLLAAGVAGWIYLSRQGEQTASGTTTTTRSIAASVDTIKKSISTNGTLTPANQQDVSFVGSGTVTDVPVSQGQQVTAGQPLGTIDTLSMQQTLAQANLTLAKARATLVNDQTALSTAQDALTTAQDNGDDTTAAQAKVDTATQQVAVDQTSIAAAQSAADAAQTALNEPTVTSPIGGVVSEVNVTVGKKVAGTGGSAGSVSSSATSTGSGTTGNGTGGTGAQGATGSAGTGTGSSSGSNSSSADFVVVGTDAWKVDVTVDSAQIGLLAVGDQAQLVADGSTDPLFGTISSVGLISTSTGSTASYPVEVAVTGTPAGLHDGASVTVSLIYEQHANVLTVPSAAIHTENGQLVVYQMNGDQQVSTPVQTGDSDGTSTEITSGLNEGDEVLVTITTGGTGAGTGRTGTGGQNGTGRGAGGFGGGTGGFGGAGGFGAGTGGFGGGAGGSGGGAPAAPPAGG